MFRVGIRLENMLALDVDRAEAAHVAGTPHVVPAPKLTHSLERKSTPAAPALILEAKPRPSIVRANR